jgi:heat-inducible transcriptional repressor
MRRVALEVLKKRKIKILNAVIHQYVRTGKPVGSNVLIKEYNISLSPATIRNLMAELEKDGYLAHPHTSAGRIPTDKGYRSYVDSLVKLQSCAIEEEERIEREYERRHNEIEDILSKTSRILSGLSRYTGFVVTPKAQYEKIKNIELVQISKEDLLVILLTQSGMIKHKKIKAYLIRDQLDKLRNFLNEKLRGISIARANRKIVLEIKGSRQNESEILKIAEKISEIFYNIQDDVYIDGTSNVVAVPDFSDFEPIKLLIKFNEDKEKFMEVINKDFNSGRINVKIGSENTLDGLKDLSVITTAYKNKEHVVGVLGIIGPKRMEYEKMMSLVNHISEMLNRFFKEKK